MEWRCHMPTPLNSHSLDRRFVANILICIREGKEVVWLVTGRACHWLCPPCVLNLIWGGWQDRGGGQFICIHTLIVRLKPDIWNSALIIFIYVFKNLQSYFIFPRVHIWFFFFFFCKRISTNHNKESRSCVLLWLPLTTRSQSLTLHQLACYPMLPFIMNHASLSLVSQCVTRYNIEVEPHDLPGQWGRYPNTCPYNKVCSVP